jgi:hypothetical protein
MAPKNWHGILAERHAPVNEQIVAHYCSTRVDVVTSKTKGPKFASDPSSCPDGDFQCCLILRHYGQYLTTFVTLGVPNPVAKSQPGVAG